MRFGASSASVTFRTRPDSMSCRRLTLVPAHLSDRTCSLIGQLRDVCGRRQWTGVIQPPAVTMSSSPITASNRRHHRLGNGADEF